MAYGVRRYEGRVRNPSYQRNLFHAQPPVGRGCGGALAINSDDGATQQLPCSELLSHWACRWPLLPVMPHPYNYSCLSCRRHVKLTPARQPNSDPMVRWPGSNRVRRTRRERCLWTIGQRFVGCIGRRGAGQGDRPAYAP
jgi:hypothetical protein